MKERDCSQLRLTPSMILKRGHYLYFATYWIRSLIYDYRIAGRRLDGVLFNDKPENYPAQSISYPYLEQLPSRLNLNRSDVFVDIGCGWGRLIGYLAFSTNAARYVGIELNSIVAECACLSACRNPKIELIEGDAVEKLPNDATVLFMFNPFGAATLESFLACAERRCKTGTRLFYLHPEHRKIVDERTDKWGFAQLHELKPKHMGTIFLLEYRLNRGAE